MPKLKKSRKRNNKKNRLLAFKKGFIFRGAELAALYHITKTITSTLNLNEVLELIVKEAAKIVEAKVGVLRLIEEGQNILKVAASYGISDESLRLKDDLRIGRGIAGMVAKRGKVIIVNDLERDGRYEYPELARREKWSSMISIPLIERQNIIGTLSIYSSKIAAFGKEEARLLTTLAGHAAIAIENARLFERTRVNYLSTMKLLAAVIDAKDGQTEDHSERVLRASLAIADEIGLTKQQREILQYASYLHDLGKISVDSTILNKPGGLTTEEWEEIKKHPIAGAEILQKLGFKDGLVQAILHHHAKFAGGGYPDPGLKMEDIPIEARILAVADSYEAMVSDRPYRKALAHEQAIEELKRCAGTQFDPTVVNAFLKVLEKG